MECMKMYRERVYEGRWFGVMYVWTVGRYEILVIRLQAITATTHSARFHRYRHHAREITER